jgi:hypothetical protein
MRKVLLLMGIAGAAACVPEAQYAYHPAEQATATLGGEPAARYGIPPESPRGSARVASFGVTEVETSAGSLPTLHVRLTIANNNDTGPWELDARELRVVYDRGEVAAPAFLNMRPRAAGAPGLSIAPGEAASVDAYFPLPAYAESAARVPRFDLIWHVDTPSREIAERTPFERIRIEPDVSVRAGYGLGMWPMWWYGPLYEPGPRVIIHARPRVYGR